MEDHRIQITENDAQEYILWTCEGYIGEYSLYGEPDYDIIKFCPFCGSKLTNDR